MNRIEEITNRLHEIENAIRDWIDGGNAALDYDVLRVDPTVLPGESIYSIVFTVPFKARGFTLMDLRILAHAAGTDPCKAEIMLICADFRDTERMQIVAHLRD